MTDIITSTKNEFVKYAKTLKSKKGRVNSGAFLVDGEKCVNELITHRPDLLQTIVAAPDSHIDIVSAAKNLGANVQIVKDHVMSAVSDFKTSQGIAAIAKIQEDQAPSSGFILALSDVADPQNVGTMIRTADAAGCSGIVLSAQSADFLSPKTVRASMGSVFHIPVSVVILPQYLQTLKESGYRIAAADMHGSSEYDYDPCKTCLVIGNEARGVSEDILNICTDKISIPMYGKAESLNAAVAAGILIYKIRT